MNLTAIVYQTRAVIFLHSYQFHSQSYMLLRIRYFHITLFDEGEKILGLYLTNSETGLTLDDVKAIKRKVVE